MNRFFEAVETIKLEMADMVKQYEAIKALRADNVIEQEKIVEQNRTIAHTIDEQRGTQKTLDEKESQLNEREKQIVIKEKQNLMVEAKIKELQDRTAEVLIQEKKLKLRQEEYEKNKIIQDKQTEVYKKLDETEVMRKTRLKLKEEEVDKELERLKNMSI